MPTLSLPHVLIRRPPKVVWPRAPLPPHQLWATETLRREAQAERFAFAPHPMRGELPYIPRHRGRYCLRCGQAVLFGTTVRGVLTELEVPAPWRAFYERLDEVENWLSIMPEDLAHVAASGAGGNGRKLILAPAKG